MKHMISRIALVAFVAVAATGILNAANPPPNPQDYDFKLIPALKSLRQGDLVDVDVTLTARKEGVQGWSYGVKHDPAILEIVQVTDVGTDLPGAFKDGFKQITIIENESSQEIGWIQAVILAFTDPTGILPVTPKFVMAKARYKVLSGICQTQPEIPTKVEFTDQLSVKGSPQAVDINVTVGGQSAIPAVLESADLVVQCPNPADLDLKLVAQTVGSPRLFT